ncbi:DUF3052 family protein [Undibacterium danionis]|uniref:DUF3052 family protein n=1 Tax=Undibacterium danionis TaxID=1812100 RepID=A0ABV6IE74_9BURK
MNAQTSGYSGTPLAKKLGITENTQVYTIQAPDDYLQLLAPIPEGVQFMKKLGISTDIVHVFTKEKTQLQAELIKLRSTIKANGVIWISWPKKASKVPTDITEDTIREIALPLGLVDIKVCAVSEIWSGLKLVIRKELR